MVALGAGRLCEDMCDVTVTAEAPTARKRRSVGAKRIDLLVEWKDSSEQKNRYAAAIEAKLPGHHVTVGQLPEYRRYLKNLDRNRDWRWMAWRDLLVAHERALPVKCDDDAYLQFRRTLWDQAG